MAELGIYGELAAYVVCLLRRNGKEFNSVDYAEKVISSVRSNCDEKIGRQPGMQQHGSLFNHLARTLKSLRELVPTQSYDGCQSCSIS